MEMKSRRTFLRLGIVGIVSFFVFVWDKLTLNYIETNNRKQVSFPVPQNKPVSFYNNYIVIRQNDKIRVLSSHCTHLGCKINRTENGLLICPCHGSEYDLSGKVVKGPAYKNLEEVPFKISSDGEQLEIKD